jgi:hypothetical protein
MPRRPMRLMAVNLTPCSGRARQGHALSCPRKFLPVKAQQVSGARAQVASLAWSPGSQKAA